VGRYLGVLLTSHDSSFNPESLK